WGVTGRYVQVVCAILRSAMQRSEKYFFRKNRKSKIAKNSKPEKSKNPQNFLEKKKLAKSKPGKNFQTAPTGEKSERQNFVRPGVLGVLQIFPRNLPSCASSFNEEY